MSLETDHGSMGFLALGDDFFFFLWMGLENVFVHL